MKAKCFSWSNKSACQFLIIVLFLVNSKFSSKIAGGGK